MRPCQKWSSESVHISCEFPGVCHRSSVCRHNDTCHACIAADLRRETGKKDARSATHGKWSQNKTTPVVNKVEQTNHRRWEPWRREFNSEFIFNGLSCWAGSICQFVGVSHCRFALCCFMFPSSFTQPRGPNSVAGLVYFW